MLENPYSQFNKDIMSFYVSWAEWNSEAVVWVARFERSLLIKVERATVF